MPSSLTESKLPRAAILIVLVLYRQSLRQSRSWITLEKSFAEAPALRGHFDLLIYDNSPNLSDEDLSGLEDSLYVHDQHNSGLAGAYNYALRLAAERQTPWLLLLDQDTTLTADYLAEVAAVTSTVLDQPTVAAIVPKLESPKGIKSPTLDFLDWLRRQFKLNRRPLFVDRDIHGLQHEQFAAFNSGAVLRVSALQAIGGFPSEFWLDFLDVAVFHALHHAGGRVYILHACLSHDLSMDSTGFYDASGAFDRHINVLQAMIRFVKRHGTPADRRLHRFWLLRNAWSQWKNTSDKRFAKASLYRAMHYHDK